MTINFLETELSEDDQQWLEWCLVDFDRCWTDTLLSQRHETIPPERLRLRSRLIIEMVKIDLEHRWLSGQRVGLEWYMQNFTELGDRDHLPTELVCAEYEVRKQFGTDGGLQELAARFPRQAAELHALIDRTRSVIADAELADPNRATRPFSNDSTPSRARELTAAANLPKEFGRYRIVRQLGRGGMGTVYLAHDTQLDRDVALKVPHFSADDDPEVLERFYREARAAATLDHPNICPVHDVGQIGGIHYISMAFVEGKRLSEFVRRDKPLAQHQVAAAIRKLALALEDAHSRGVVHRDLKPSNILINRRREPIIMDFGLAQITKVAQPNQERITHSGMTIGTPAYMSPEQVHGDIQVIGPRSDVYSLGVIMYELLTGRLPFDGPVTSVLAKIVTQEPQRPAQVRKDLDPELERICLRAMAKEPSKRFESMAALAQSLADYLRSGSRAVPARQGTAADARITERLGTTGVADELAAEFFAELAHREPTPAPRSVVQSGKGRVRKRLSVALAAAAALVLFGVTVYIATDYGTLRIELSDPNADLQISVDGELVTIDGLQEPLRLRARKHGLEITGTNYETVSREFVVRRGPTTRYESN